jgi:hypothetical protein
MKRLEIGGGVVNGRYEQGGEENGIQLNTCFKFEKLIFGCKSRVRALEESIHEVFSSGTAYSGWAEMNGVFMQKLRTCPCQTRTSLCCNM